MLAIFLSPIYIILCIYLCLRIIHYLSSLHSKFKEKTIKAIVIITFITFMISPAIAFILPVGTARTILKHISNLWLGVVLYTLFIVLIIDIIAIVIKHFFKKKYPGIESDKSLRIVGSLCAIISITISIYGSINARNINITNYDVTISKKVQNINELNVVLISDLHIGYNVGIHAIENMVDKVNECNPDLIVIAGDIFDNEYDSVEKPEQIIETLKRMKSKYGVYACYGNHDVSEKILVGFTFNNKNTIKKSDPRMDEFLKKANITLLQDEYTLIDDSFYLYGRRDYSKPGIEKSKRKTATEVTEELDKTKPIILIDHQPRELQQLADANVDLDLSGHTHDGQLFPGNILTKIKWENSCGMIKKDDMTSIVTSGVGVYGPYLRVGTKAEICNIKITFKK